MSAKEYFNNAAETWDEKYITPKLFSFLDKVVPQLGLEAGQNVLDVGTGTGVLIPYLSKAVGSEGSVTAIDFSEKMVQKCNQKHSHLSNVNIKLGNIENEQFSAKKFDTVIFFGVFPHIENKEKVLINVNKFLKTNGRLLIAHAMSSKELKTHHKKVSKHVAHSILPKEDEMKKLLEKMGFIRIRIKDEPGSYFCIADKS